MSASRLFSPLFRQTRVSPAFSSTRAMSSSNVDRFRIQRSDTALFLCDVQTKFTGIHRFDIVIETAKKMLAAGKELDIPLVVTEQKPSALGPTVPDLDVSGAKIKVAKTLFSMCVPEVKELLKELGKKTVILFGVESHVCVTQTAFELMPDYNVVVLADGVSSMNYGEVGLALQRMRDAGAQIASSESVLFQLVKDASDPKFKAISNLVKGTKETTSQALDALVLGKN